MLINTYTFKELIELFDMKHSDIFQTNRGAGVLLVDDNGLYFLLSKPKYWEQRGEYTIIKFGGVGGSIEDKESPITCLKREIAEEVKINCDDIKFAFPKTTLIIDNENIVDEIQIKQESGVPAPIYILELNLPLRSDKRIKGKHYSCLQLFVYLAKLANNRCDFGISEAEDITAVMYVHESLLPDILRGNMIIENKIVADGIEIYWNSKLRVEIPTKIMLHPRFSPIGLIRAKYNFNMLMSLFD